MQEIISNLQMVTKVELFKIHNISLPRLENDLTPKKNPSQVILI